MNEFLYGDGRYYDLISPQTVDQPYWLALAQRYGGPVGGPTSGPILELACGTGRVTIPLAEAGYAVTGLDLSAAMLAEARRKSIGHGLPVTWVLGDMRHFDLGQTFALIILPFNTLCHLMTIDDLAGCLACVRRHLRPDGRFALDMFVPDMTLLLRDPETHYFFADYYDETGRRVVITSTGCYAPDTQISHLTAYRTDPDGVESEIGTLDMRMYYPQELAALLMYNGLSMEHRFGYYDQRPFDESSEQQLIVCHLASQSKS